MNYYLFIYSFIIYLLNYLIIKKEKYLSNKWINIYSFIIYLLFICLFTYLSKWINK